MSELKVHATERSELGKNRANKLRQEKKVPAVVYGRDKENLHIALDARELEKVYGSAGMTTIVDVVLGDNEVPVLFKEVVRHPYKNQFIHVDFHAINMNERIRVQVPVVLLNRDDIRAEGNFVLMQGVSEVEIECLPADIPEEIAVDVSALGYDEPIFLKDLPIYQDENVTVHADGEEVIASLTEVQEQAEEEETEGEETSAADVPVVGEEESEDEEE